MKISERANEILISDQGVYPTRDAAQVWALREALDEWQASVEKRLGVLVEVVNEIQLRSISGEPSKDEPEPE